MKHLLFQTVLLLAIITTSQFAQNNLILVQKNNSNKQVSLPLDKNFEIKTSTNFYKTKIISVGEKEIKIIQTNLKRDPTAANHPFNWVNDTVKISIQDIKFIKANRYNKRRWIIPFASIAALTIGSTYFNPLVSVAKGRSAADKMTVIQLAIIVITVPPILIGISKKKYDLKNKWKIKGLD